MFSDLCEKVYSAVVYLQWVEEEKAARLVASRSRAAPLTKSLFGAAGSINRSGQTS